MILICCPPSVPGKILEGIRRGEYLDAPDFVESLIENGMKVSHFAIEGTWIDIGSPDDFRYANEVTSRRF